MDLIPTEPVVYISRRSQDEMEFHQLVLAIDTEMVPQRTLTERTMIAHYKKKVNQSTGVWV